MTWAMSSFMYGYLISQIPGGILSEYYGGKHVFGTSVLMSAIATIVTPISIKYLEWKGLILTRVVMGLAQVSRCKCSCVISDEPFQGLSIPSLACLLGQWVPKHERARLGSLSFGAVQIGSLLGTAITGWVIDVTEVWESVFYLFGAVALLWYGFWLLLCYSYPATHPFIKDKEFYYLQQQLGTKRALRSSRPTVSNGSKFLLADFDKIRNKKRDYPLAGIFTNLAVWSLALAEFGHDFSFFLLGTYLPIYFKEVHNLSIATNGVYSGIPYVVRFVVGLICGFLGDYLVVKSTLSITNIRKIFTGLSK